MNQEVDRIKNIVSDLLLFSKPSEPDRSPTDIQKIVADIADLLTSNLLTHHIAFKQGFDVALPKVFVDPGQIKQALLNLVMNAVDAMKGRGGELAISAKVSEGQVEIVIRDTGCGIPADKLPYVFDPFYTSKDHGTGLGLAVTHAIIEKNHGRIEVTSVVGRGTEFKMFLPVAL